MKLFTLSVLYSALDACIGCGLIVMLIAFAGCQQSAEAPAQPATSHAQEKMAPKPLPVPEETMLLAGRSVVEKTCAECHIPGHEGAPVIGVAKDWEKRAEKGLDVLGQRAIEGFFGPTYAEMPPRGGNKELTDDEVRQAVAYMVWASTNK